ncbi:MAG: hypothetical protein H8E55_69710 [Pelagibacterales bacterium]|nr:hypothetical protein [Pelagibacterales bacterium]
MEKEVMKQALELMPGELKEEIKSNLENPKSYTRLFIKVLDEIDRMKVVLPKFTALKNSILKINKKNHSKITDEMKHLVPKTQSTLSVKDIEYWLQTAKKGDQLIYYTGGTFDRRSVKDESVFRKAQNLAMDYDNIPFKNKKYQYRGSVRGEWGCNYKDIITLVQKRVAKEQRDKIWDEDKKRYVPGNIISYPIYNYIMIKQ